MIVIVDIGIGNLRSLSFKIQKMGIKAEISSASRDIERADKLILPGVGHFAAAMSNMEKLGLRSVLDKAALKNRTPILGICLGMQLFTRESEEGNAKGLGWIPGKTVRFDLSQHRNSLRIPHVGWNSITVEKPSAIWTDVDLEKRFYFTHSYYVSCENSDHVAATTEYGLNFVSAVQNENIVGTQFHPEKSHGNGMKIIENFCREFGS